jgi:hypothetical protein
MTFPDVPLGVRLEVAPGADVIADDPEDWPWLDVSTAWHVTAGIRVEDGRSEGAVQAEPSTLAFSLKNDDGEWTPDDPRSTNWPDWVEGCPARVSVNPGSGWTVLPGSSTFVDEILPTWTDGSSRQALVAVTAKGLLHILGRGQDPPRSAAYRAILAGSPIGFWPLTDGADAAAAASALTDCLPATIESDGPYAPRQINTWLEPILTPEDGAFALIEGRVNQNPADTAWAGDFVFAWDAAATGAIFFSWEGYGSGSPGSPRDEWTLTLFDDSPGVLGYTLTCQTFDGTVTGHTILVDDTIAGYLDGALHHIRVTTSNSGANTAWELILDGSTIASDTTTGPWDVVAGVFFDWDATDGQISLGMVAVWDTASPLLAVADAAAAAVHGRRGEPAGVRIARTCAEAGIRVSITGDPAATEPMGPQSLGQILDILRACEAGDRGVLGEQEFGLHYLTRRARYSRTVALTIDAGQRQLHRDFAPRRDLQRVRNEWTVSRRNGSEATARDPVHQARRGRLSDSVELEIDADARLVHHAGWRVREGTTPGLRHPELVIRLDTTPALVAPWLALLLGDWVAAVNLMPQYPPDGLLQLVEGRSQTIAGRRGPWKATMRVSPAAPWRVFTLDHPVLGRLETGGSELAAEFEAGTDTSMSVTVTGEALWDTTDVPFDIVALGVRLTVTAVAGASSPQTFTVEQTPANGVEKTIPAGTTIKTYGTGVLGL